jgi:hypothetical protein
MLSQVLHHRLLFQQLLSLILNPIETEDSSTVSTIFPHFCVLLDYQFHAGLKVSNIEATMSLVERSFLSH